MRQFAARAALRAQEGLPPCHVVEAQTSKTERQDVTLDRARAALLLAAVTVVPWLTRRMVSA